MEFDKMSRLSLLFLIKKNDIKCKYIEKLLQKQEWSAEEVNTAEDIINRERKLFSYKLYKKSKKWQALRD